MIVTDWLEVVKRHCRVDLSYNGDDDYLEQLIAAAKVAVAWQTDAKEEEDEPEPIPLEDVAVAGESAADESGGDGDEGEEIPAEVVQAVCILVGEWYKNREVTGANDKPLPKSFDYLVGINRRYTVK